MHGFLFRRLQVLIVAFFLLFPCCFCIDLVAQVLPIAEVHTPTLRLDWQQGRHEPSNWEVLAGNKNNSESWHSMVTRSVNGAIISQHLRVTGAIQNELLQCGATTKTGLHLFQSFEKSGQPYCFKMLISLENTSGIAFIPLSKDNLTLTLGPGMGQTIPAPASGASNSTFVEPVASLKGQVNTYRDGTTQPRNLGWNKPQYDWAGLHDRYFAILILPAEPSKGQSLPFTQTVVKFSSPDLRSSPDLINLPLLSFKIPVKSIMPGQVSRWEFLVFSGPKSQNTLAVAPVNLNGLLFSGLWNWIRWICFGLLWLLSVLHMALPGWGWSIIMLALIVRILLYPLAKKALISQQRFVDAQKVMLPELTEIKKNYKGGEQSERILQLYKKYDVSPLAGLKPLMVVLIQLPILIALFQVLGAVYEFRDAGFLWVHSLAEPGRLFSFGFNIPILGSYFNLLPVLMAVVTLLSFKLSPSPTAGNKGQLLQNLFMIGMTLLFFLLFYSFPAGMVLYWTFANVFHIIQNKIMIRNRKGRHENRTI